eukprot:1475626-Amphidinium_carterae.1
MPGSLLSGPRWPNAWLINQTSCGPHWEELRRGSYRQTLLGRGPLACLRVAPHSREAWMELQFTLALQHRRQLQLRCDETWPGSLPAPGAAS